LIIDAPFNSDIPYISDGVVLIADSDPAVRAVIADHLVPLGRRVTAVERVEQALTVLAREKCDLILLAIEMKEAGGHDLLEIVRADGEFREIPVIVISDAEHTAMIVRCIENGAADILKKPLDGVLLRARVSAALEYKALRDRERANLRQLIEIKQQLADRNLELERLNRRLEAAALTDVLTGLPNRRFAIEELQRAWAAADRHHHPLACLLIDVDHFKRINDTMGHDAGDAVLQAVASRLRASLRSDEVVCRLGGEEFLVVCRQSSRDCALKCAERLRTAVAARTIEHRGQSLTVTVSVGVADRKEDVIDVDDLLKLADLAVYRAKQLGRDRVCLPPAVTETATL